MRKLIIVTLTAAILLALASVAEASPTMGVAYARNESSGVLGAYARTHIADRHYYGEFYLIKLNNPANKVGDWPCVLAWEIAQRGKGQPFYPYIHIKYKKGSNYYPGDEYEKWYTDKPVSPNAWHSLRIVHAGGNYWDLILDGTKIARVWWPYPSGNEEWTQLECGYESGQPNYFMGRHIDIQLLASNGK